MTENTETLTDGSAGLFRPWSPEVTVKNCQSQFEFVYFFVRYVIVW